MALLCLITEGTATSRNFLRCKTKILSKIKEAVEDGVTMIQIREKNITAKQVFELAKAAKKETSAKGAILLVNERADIALAAGADGVHLPSRAVTTTVLRRIVPPDLIIGVSTHSADEVLRAREEGADFTVFGPVFESPGKGEPVGLEELTAVCAAAEGFPILALGGVNEKNCTDVLNAGARGVAAIRALNESTSRRQILKKIGHRLAGSVKDS